MSERMTRSISNFRVSILLIGILATVNGLFACAAGGNQRLEYRYFGLNPPINEVAIFVYDSGSQIFFDSVDQGSDVSRHDTTDFHHFSVPGTEGIRFAYPINRPKDTKDWKFKRCSYRIVEKSGNIHDLDPETETASTFLSILAKCNDQRWDVLYLYQEEMGLAGFSLGRATSIDGRESFDETDTFVLSGKIGFGSMVGEKTN